MQVPSRLAGFRDNEIIEILTSNPECYTGFLRLRRLVDADAVEAMRDAHAAYGGDKKM